MAKKITCEDALHLSLDDLQREIEICDKSGRTIGRYLPESKYRKLLYDLTHDLFTEEELDLAERQPGGRQLGVPEEVPRRHRCVARPDRGRCSRSA